MCSSDLRSSLKPKQHQETQASIRLPEKLKKQITNLLKRASGTPAASQRDRSSKNHVSSIQATNRKDKGSSRSLQKDQSMKTHDLSTMKTYDPSAMDYDAITVNFASTEEQYKQEKFCHHCRRPGHVKSNCDKLEQPATKACYVCRKLGHLGRSCKKRCNHCHKAHLTENCGRQCNYCGREGHPDEDCRKFKGGEKPLPKVGTWVATTEETPPTCDAKSLVDRINQMEAEDRSKFVDRLLIESEEDRC